MRIECSISLASLLPFSTTSFTSFTISMHWQHLALFLVSGTLAVQGLPLSYVNRGLEKRDKCHCSQACPKHLHKRGLLDEEMSLNLGEHEYNLTRKKNTGSFQLVWSIADSSTTQNPKHEKYYYAKGPVKKNEATVTRWYWGTDFLTGQAGGSAQSGAGHSAQLGNSAGKSVQAGPAPGSSSQATASASQSSNWWILMPKVGIRLREWAYFRELMNDQAKCHEWVKNTLAQKMNAALNDFRTKANKGKEGQWMFVDIKTSHFRLVLHNAADQTNTVPADFDIKLIDFGAARPYEEKKDSKKIEQFPVGNESSTDPEGRHLATLQPWLNLCDSKVQDDSSMSDMDSQKLNEGSQHDSHHSGEQPHQYPPGSKSQQSHTSGIVTTEPAPKEPPLIAPHTGTGTGSDGGSCCGCCGSGCSCPSECCTC
ncbi:hypothetical protein FRC14_000847 [Serendipita sp. 396]|nr:hypothetical protein FRC14_000847 [Serendipita sp. 396]KAG8778150.1 hypothetical protein FRC15_010939 [Serendipita sp. 397]KAG8790681.1 hypothetical protein FRC16_000761 [Serendipita sp. 398]